MSGPAGENWLCASRAVSCRVVGSVVVVVLFGAGGWQILYEMNKERVAPTFEMKGNVDSYKEDTNEEEDEERMRKPFGKWGKNVLILMF